MAHACFFLSQKLVLSENFSYLCKQNAKTMNRELTIDSFIDYLTHERRARPRTVETYEKHLRQFEEWLHQRDAQLGWRDVDRDLIRDWMSDRMDGGMTAKSISTRLPVLRSFFRYALRYGLLERDPAHLVETPKVPKPLPKFVREKEMDRLLDDEGWDDSLTSLRERAVLTVLYETGIRRSELCGLNDADVDLSAMQMRVTGKGDKTRVVPFGPEVADAISRYREARDREQGGADGALFLNTKGQRITGFTVWHIVHNQLSRVTTLRQRSPHVLRHSYATALLNHGAQIEGVRRLLGHASLEATEIYTHATFEQLRRAYEKAHPRE